MSDEPRGWDGDLKKALEARVTMSTKGDVFAQVRAFWEIGHTEKLADRPQMPSDASLQLCLKLIREERLELTDAIDAGDLVEMADALGDLMYVTIGMGLACGFPMREVFDEIQRTNMAKFPGGVVTRRPSDGKVMKPEGWTPPDIKGILERATNAATPCGHEWNGRVCIGPQGHPIWHRDGKTSWRADYVEEQCPAGETVVLDSTDKSMVEERTGWRCIHPEKHSGDHVDEDGNEHYNAFAHTRP
ncbi:MAG: hypothetical protein O7G84_00940 [Gammaproteobacteria bacterium]|nr:hypothetical protein [Gammaproteobacteria bacterium]